MDLTIGLPDHGSMLCPHRQVLIDDFNGDGPASALPPGSHMITRYDWTNHRTGVVAVFADRATAEAELGRLRAADMEDCARGKTVRSWFFALVPRPQW